MNMPEQFKEMSKENVEATMRFAQIYMSSAEKLLKLQLDAAKTALFDQAEHTKAFMDAKDAEQLVTLRTKHAESNIATALDYSSSVYDIASETQKAVSALLEQQLTSINKAATQRMEGAVKGVPMGNEMAVAALKNTMAATAAAVDSMTKAAKQVAEFADVSVRAASAAAEQAKKKVTKSTTSASKKS